MVDVRRVKLPGVGVLHTFYTSDGGKVGVIAHRSGHSDLITFADDEDGPDATKVSLPVCRRPGRAHPRRVARRHPDHRVAHRARPDPRSLDRLVHRRLRRPHRRPAPRQPADRGIAGLTVVAVVRGESANPAPAADFKVFPGDTLVVAGSPEKVAKAFTFFRTGEMKAKAGALDCPPGG